LKQAAAWEWLKFFLERDQNAVWSIKSGYMPLRRSAADQPDLKAYWDAEPQARQAFQLTPHAVPEPTIPAWHPIRELLQNALSAVLAQKQPGRQAVEEAAAKANKLLDEQR
jgi:ABC-type glycerol-3-phosphate transport system substrate-binding protein